MEKPASAKAPKGTRKICAKGHTFYKSSDCPACPICAAEQKPESGFLASLGAPARRALESAGIMSEEQLATYSQKEILKLHGIGPSSIPRLKAALAKKGLQFNR